MRSNLFKRIIKHVEKTISFIINNLRETFDIEKIKFYLKNKILNLQIHQLFVKTLLIIVILFTGCEKDEDVLIDNNKEFINKMKQSYLDSISYYHSQQNNILKTNNNSVDGPNQFVNEIKEITNSYLNTPVNNFSGQLISNYASTLDNLIISGQGAFSYGFEKTDNYTNNGLTKIILPETKYWQNKKDKTYHSYNLIRNLGSITSYITQAKAINILLNNYSYPGYKLNEVNNVLNGGGALVFGSLNASDQNGYVIPGGIIEQISIPGGILNITTPNHNFYKGTIRKVIFSYKNNLFLATHGEGINRFINLPNNFVNSIIFNQMANMNDAIGPVAFATLDLKILNKLHE